MTELTEEYSLSHAFSLVENAAFEFNAKLEESEKFLRKNAITIPSDDIKHSLANAYWHMFDVIETLEKEHPNDDLSEYKATFRAIVSPWLCRSKFFWRSLAKPHGYAGDFKIIDWMYDLEDAPGEDPTEPGIVNCLDYIFSTNDSVVSLWDRRHWLSNLLSSEFNTKKSLKVLDIACGGARYLRDFLEGIEHTEDVEITLLDQDPAALAFAKSINLHAWPDQVTSICEPIKHLSSVVPDTQYDVIISSGLFDYLDHEAGSSILSFLSHKLSDKGVLAITNYHTEDGSILSKDWSADWPLIFRTEQQVKDLYPGSLSLTTLRSKNGSLVMAAGRK